MTRCTAQNNPHIRRAVTTAAEVAEQQLMELEKLAHDIGVTFGANVHASNYVGRTLEIRRKLRAALARIGGAP